MAGKEEEEAMIEKAKKIITESREGREKKGGFLGGFFGKKDKNKPSEDALKGFGKDEDVITEVKATEESAPLVEERDPTLREIVARIEKIGGKLEVERDLRSNIESHVSDVSERVGELRTTVLERDRSFRNIEEEFGKFKALIETVQPQEIRKELNERQIEVLSGKAKIEVLNDQLEVLKANVEKISTAIENVKSFENLSKILKDLDEKIAIIENTKRDTDKSSGKVEAVFIEMNKRIIEFEKRKTQIDSLDEVLKDTVKNVDQLGVKVDNVAKKEDFFSELRKYVTKEEIATLKKYISPEEIDKLREGIKNFEDALNRQKQIEKSLSDLNSKLNKSNDSIEDFNKEFSEFKKEDDKKHKKFNDTLSEYDANIDSVKKMEMRELKDLGTRIDFIEGSIKDFKNRISELEFEAKGAGESKEEKGVGKKIKKIFGQDKSD